MNTNKRKVLFYKYVAHLAHDLSHRLGCLYVMVTGFMIGEVRTDEQMDDLKNITPPLWRGTPECLLYQVLISSFK